MTFANIWFPRKVLASWRLNEEIRDKKASESHLSSAVPKI